MKWVYLNLPTLRNGLSTNVYISTMVNFLLYEKGNLKIDVLRMYVALNSDDGENWCIPARNVLRVMSKYFWKLFW